MRRQPMDFTRLPKPPELLAVTRGKSMQPTEEFGRQYRKQYQHLVGVFPLDSDAWKAPGGLQAHVPLEDPAEFTQIQYAVADASSQARTAEFFTGIHALEKRQWEANGKVLREYQKALIFWQSMSICTGVRDQIAAQLIRAAFNMGKSIIGGTNMEFFRNMQYRQLRSGVEPQDVPMAGYMFMRSEHGIQNALGEQCIVQNPPYTFEKSHITQYYNDLTLLYGEAFTVRISLAVWKGLFAGEYASHSEVRNAVRSVLCEKKKRRSSDMPQEMIDAMVGILSGDIVYVPGPDNRPVPKAPPRRLSDVDAHTYKGDALHGTPPMELYPVKASHKDLLPDRTPASLDDQGKELLYVMSSSIVMGSRARTREDIRQALRRICDGGMLIGDEMGRFNPEQIRHPFTARDAIGGKKPPFLVGLTADFKGRPGWTLSPELPEKRGIELGVLPHIGYEYIGPQKKGELVSPGTEEAWRQFLAARLRDVPLAKEFGIKQPRDRNTIVVVSTATEAIEYMERYALHCAEHGIPWDVSAYCGKLRRYKEAIRQWFSGPGDGKTLFTTETDIGHALHFSTLENIETVCRLQNGRQLLGRLHHNATMLPGKSGSAALRRVTFREHGLRGCKPILRSIAEQQGIALPEEGLTWLADQLIIDQKGYRQDQQRPEVKKLSKSAVSVMEMRSGRWGDKVGTPLVITNAFSVAQQRKKEGRLPRIYDFTPDSDGLISPMTLQQWLSNERLSTSWVSAVRMAVRDAYQAKKRGRDLAMAAYKKIDHLLEKGSKRNGTNGPEHDVTVYRAHI